MRVLADENVPRGIGPAERLAALVGARSDWPGHFTVIEPGRVRLRPLSPGA